MKIPSVEEEKDCYRNFVEGTSMHALSEEVCVVCMCQQWSWEGRLSCDPWISELMLVFEQVTWLYLRTSVISGNC